MNIPMWILITANFASLPVEDIESCEKMKQAFMSVSRGSAACVTVKLPVVKVDKR